MTSSPSIAIAGTPHEPISVSLDQPLTVVAGRWHFRDFAQVCVAASLPRLVKSPPCDLLVVDTSLCSFSSCNSASLLAWPIINDFQTAFSFLKSLPNLIHIKSAQAHRHCTVIISDLFDFVSADTHDEVTSLLRAIKDTDSGANISVVAIGSQWNNNGDVVFNQWRDEGIPCVNLDDLHPCFSIPSEWWHAWTHLFANEELAGLNWPPHRRKYARLLASIDSKARSQTVNTSPRNNEYSAALSKALKDLAWWLGDGGQCDAPQDHLDDLADSHWWLNIAAICTEQGGPIANYPEWYASI